MELTRVDPDTDAGAVRACHEMYLAARRMDAPLFPPFSFQSFRGWLAFGWTEDPVETWLARDSAGGPCGFCHLTLPERENREYASLSTVVPPARRRAGIGRALVAHAAGRARLAGRVTMTAESVGAAGEAFARALGARRGLSEIHRVLRLDAMPEGHLASLRKQAENAADGYCLVSWTGPVPEGRLADAAALFGMLADAPREEGLAAQHWDSDRVRHGNRRITAQGLRWYTVGARHRGTGELAALTEISVDPPNPQWAEQGLTAVTRPHRGHRLGLLVKVAMLEWLAQAEPQVTRVITGNADGNDHMIAINAELGFEPIDEWPSWELSCADAGSQS